MGSTVRRADGSGQEPLPLRTHTLRAAKLEALLNILSETPSGADLRALKESARELAGLRRAEVDSLLQQLINEGRAVAQPAGRCVRVLPVKRVPTRHQPGRSGKL